MKNFNFYSRGQSLVGIIIVLVIASLISGGLYYYLLKQSPDAPEIIEKPSGEEIVKPKKELPKEEVVSEKKVEEKLTEEAKPEVICQNECSKVGLKECFNNSYRICGNYDADTCLEWSSITNCPSNTICQNGICIQQKCADGTSYGQCSTNKPKYCVNGNLVDKCSICGCPTSQYCDESSNLCKIQEKFDIFDFDMLIILSPQYANDFQIMQAINEYIDAVKTDIGWNIKIIKITSDINDFRKIDKIIEDYYVRSERKLKAALIVGEDINTPLGAEVNDHNPHEAPSVIPWSSTENYKMIRKNENITCGGVVGQVICEVKDKNTGEVIEKFNEKDGRILNSGSVILSTSSQKLEIVISFLYPTHEWNYTLKSQYLQSVFKKFAKDRKKIYPKESVMFVDQEEDYIKKTREILSQYSNLYFKEKPNENEVKSKLNREYMLYLVSSHALPNLIEISPPPATVNFYSFYLEGKEIIYTAGGGEKGFIYHSSLNTPLFIGGGCYTEGWWTNDFKGNDQLNFSIDKEWFGSKIFTNSFLKAAVLGKPNTLGEGKTFVEIALPDLMKGKTLAESLVGKFLRIGQITIYGDPTFHYNF